MRRRGRGCGGVGGKSSGGGEVDSVAEVWSGSDDDEGGKDCSVDGARLIYVNILTVELEIGGGVHNDRRKSRSVRNRRWTRRFMNW